jgi:hypothetical protein
MVVVEMETAWTFEMVALELDGATTPASTSARNKRIL